MNPLVLNKNNTLSMRAVRFLTACLTSVRIPFEIRFSSVIVIRKDGQEMPVSCENDGVASGLLSRDRTVADTVFGNLTEAAGYGRLVAVNRGEPRKYCRNGKTTTRPYGDDLDAVVLREKTFRSSPNLPAEVYKTLDPTIMTCCRFFYQRNSELCARLGYDLYDLKTYAQVWATNFWAVSRIPAPTHPSDNLKLLYRVLRQRFAEFGTYMQGPRFRTLPDQETVSIANGTECVLDTDSSGGRSHGTVVDWKVLPIAEEEEGEGAPVKSKRAVLNTSSVSARRESAKQLLLRLLSELPHDNMVTALGDAISSAFTCPDTKSEAAQQLKAHQKVCPVEACHQAFLKPLLMVTAPKAKLRAERQLNEHRSECPTCKSGTVA